MSLLDWNSIENSRHGITDSLKVQYKFNPLQWSSFVRTSLPILIPCLEFTIQFQSNQLIYQKEYTKRQQIIYVLIHHLHDREGWGYQKISNWLNKSSILTHTGKNWFSSSVISVLKRKHERDLMNEQIRNQYFPSKVSRFKVKYYVLD